MFEGNIVDIKDHEYCLSYETGTKNMGYNHQGEKIYIIFKDSSFG